MVSYRSWCWWFVETIMPIRTSSLIVRIGVCQYTRREMVYDPAKVRSHSLGSSLHLTHPTRGLMSYSEDRASFCHTVYFWQSEQYVATTAVRLMTTEDDKEIGNRRRLSTTMIDPEVAQWSYVKWESHTIVSHHCHCHAPTSTSAFPRASHHGNHCNHCAFVHVALFYNSISLSAGSEPSRVSLGNVSIEWMEEHFYNRLTAKLLLFVLFLASKARLRLRYCV